MNTELLARVAAAAETFEGTEAPDALAYADVVAARGQLGVSSAEDLDPRSAGPEEPAGRLGLGLQEALPYLGQPRLSSTERIIEVREISAAASTGSVVGTPAALAIETGQDDLRERLAEEGFERRDGLWVKPEASIGPDFYSVAALEPDLALFGFDEEAVQAALDAADGPLPAAGERIRTLTGVLRTAVVVPSGSSCPQEVAFGEDLEPPQGELVIVEGGGADPDGLDDRLLSGPNAGIELGEPSLDGDTLTVPFSYDPPSLASAALLGVVPPLYNC